MAVTWDGDRDLKGEGRNNIMIIGHRFSPLKLTWIIALAFAVNTLYAEVTSLVSKCKAGDAQSCYAYGEILEFGDGVKADGALAIQYYDQACRLGSGDGCSSVAAMLYFGGNGVAKDHVKAYPYGVEGCKRNSTLGGCYYAGKIAFEGEGFKHDNNAGFTLVEHGCKMMDALSCGYGATIYSMGLFGAQTDGQTAMNYAYRGCSVSNTDGKQACFIAGWLASGNLGFEKDVTSALSFFERGCAMGDGMSCTNGGIVVQSEEGLETGAEKALSLYKKGCEKEEANGCYMVAQVMARQGRHMDGYPWAKKSCDLKLEDACRYKAALDKYKKELAEYQAARAQYEQRVSKVTEAINRNDFDAAIYQAVEQLRDRDQAARVIVAAENAGKINSIENHYIYNLSNWFTVGYATANGIVQRELKKIKEAEKASQNQIRYTPTSGTPKLSNTMADQFEKFYDESYKQNLNRYLSGGRPSDTRVYNLRK